MSPHRSREQIILDFNIQLKGSKNVSLSSLKIGSKDVK